VVGIFRRNFPEAVLAVATFAPESTAKKFQLETLPAFGFDSKYTMRDFRKCARKFDMFVWAGGTGLSDYPQIGAALLENAQKLGLKTVIWQVGMNREFNPEYFQLHGRTLKFTELFGITGYLERQMEKRMRERLQVCVSRCDLITLRDQPSLIELHNSGEFPAAVFGADSVILQEASEGELLVPDEQKRRSVGICLAEKLNQRKVRQAVDFLRHLQITENVRLVFIPMSGNDRKIMQSIFDEFSPAAGNIMVDYTAPEDIQNVVKSCSLLLSGRLQLTIMGLNALVPGIGIANSSKIANCLNMFGLPVFNNQSVIDFDQLYEECVRWLNIPEFALRAQGIRERMLNRLEQCESQLREL
jgi:polysaccharide pyruvyl transferase WcaK-like protein